jgi:hypothetical protein
VHKLLKGAVTGQRLEVDLENLIPTPFSKNRAMSGNSS